MKNPKVNARAFAKRIGMKQGQLARELGIKPETIYKWNSGENAPTYEVIYRLKKMGITDMELFGEDFPPSAKTEGEMDAAVAESLKRLVANIGKI